MYKKRVEFLCGQAESCTKMRFNPGLLSKIVVPFNFITLPSYTYCAAHPKNIVVAVRRRTAKLFAHYDEVSDYRHRDIYPRSVLPE